MTAVDKANRDTGGAVSSLRQWANVFRSTPLHPQWYAHFREERNLRATCSALHGIVLDIGCADGKPRRHLPASADYVGVDYFSTASDWYGTRPDLYADAQNLPLRDASVDHSLLLDVLEHIPDPERCLAELYRTLKRGGTLTIQVPFLYPLHDVPLDFHRWTRFGLRRAAERQGFTVSEERALGHPLETAALTANLAIAKTVINWGRQRNPLLLLGVLLPVVVPAINILAWGCSKLGPPDDFMPYAYRMVWTKS